MDQGKVLVSIIHWPPISDTIECIESVRNAGYTNLEILVVNNYPDDDLSEVDAPEITVVDMESNIGFAKAHNYSINYADKTDARYILLLNNDATLCEGSIDELVKYNAGDQKRTIYSPITYTDETKSEIEATGNYFNWFRGQPRTYTKDLDKKSELSEEKLQSITIDYLHGAILFAEVTIFKDLDGFDERFFLYYEDADLGQRALNLGIQLRPIFSAHGIHETHEESQQISIFKSYFTMRNRVWFMRKHAPRPHFYIFLIYYVTIVSQMRLVSAILKHRSIKLAKFTLWGAIDGLLGSSWFESEVRHSNE